MIQTIATIIIPVFIIIGVGYFTTVTKIISNNEISTLTKFSQSIALPILLFLNISDLDLGEVLNTDLLLSFYSSAVFCFTLGTLGSFYFFSKSLKVKAFSPVSSTIAPLRQYILSSCSWMSASFKFSLCFSITKCFKSVHAISIRR